LIVLFAHNNKPSKKAINDSSKRLQLEYVDVIYAHQFDQLTPVLEVVEAFTNLIKSGKAHYWGTSMWPNWRIIQAFYLAKKHHLIPPVVEEPKYNLLERRYMESHYLPMFNHPYNIGTTIWGVLESGVLTGKYNTSVPEGSRMDKNDRLSFVFGDYALQKKC